MTFTVISEGIITLSRELLERGQIVDSQSWQGIVSPDRTIERQFVHLVAPIPEKLELVESQTKPNMPWAVMHLSERLAGLPVNPGETYKLWPFYKNMRQGNDKFRVVEEKFTHTYMERFWPKFAGMAASYEPEYMGNFSKEEANMGIRYFYGDLNDVINLMVRDPYTRQAYLPVWFPEDTGADQGRVPCTLGYTFLLRHGKLSISYHMRSCDAARHFRDDIYLACGLLLHVLQQLRQRGGEFWTLITPGWLSMNMDSFHIFEKDKDSFIYQLKQFEKQHI